MFSNVRKSDEALNLPIGVVALLHSLDFQCESFLARSQ